MSSALSPHYGNTLVTGIVAAFDNLQATKGDAFSQIAAHVENLPKEKAFTLADKLIYSEGLNDFALGGVLAVINDRCKAGHEEWLEGHADFKSLLAKRFIKCGYHKAMRLIAAYTYLLEEKIPWSVVENLGPSKLRLLVSKEVITAKDATMWAEKAAKMTVEELTDHLRDQSLSPGKTTTITFKVHEDQKKGIDAGLAKAKDESNTKYDSVALHNVMQAYLGNAVQMDGEPKQEKPRGKRQSRVARWSEAAQQAIDAIEELVAVQEEFQEWRDNLPENLASSALADKLDAVIEIDLQCVLETMNEVADTDLPRGFGRD